MGAFAVGLRLWVGVFLLFLRSSGLEPCEPGTCVNVSVFYTAHLRGRFLPVDSTGATCDPENSATCFGGNARRAAYIQQQRAESAPSSEVLVFTDLGGCMFGGPLDSHPDYPQGKVAAMLQNLVPYDFTLLGLDDLLPRNNTPENFEELAQSHSERKSPLLLANAGFGGPLAALNSHVEPYKVESTPDGTKVGFVGMLCHTIEDANSFSLDFVGLNPHSLLAQILNGSSYQELNLTDFREDLQQLQLRDDWAATAAYPQVLYKVASLVSLDTLSAAEALKRAHPEVKAMVLLSTRCRRDVRQWMLENGPFDVILEAEPEGDWSEPTLLWSRMHQKMRVFAGSATFQGLGHLAVHVGPSGVRSFTFDADLPLASNVEHNTTVQAHAVELYEFMRKWDEEPYGSISSPLTGAQLGGMAPAMKQCYFTDCPGGDHLGKATLWKARASGHLVDVSLLPLAALRRPLEGDADGTVRISHCMGALDVQATLALYSVSGNNLYKTIRDLLGRGEIGFAGAGIRIAIHEPCWELVNRTTYAAASSSASDGECKEDVETSVQLVDVEIEACMEVLDCSQRQWRRLVKGASYTVASLASDDHFELLRRHGFRPAGTVTGTLAEALCEYVAHHSPLQVENWEAYRDRGAVQFATIEQGFASGSRVPSIGPAVSPLEGAALCLDGFHLLPGAKDCLPCEPGSRSVADPARDRCELCPPGSFSNTSGLSVCHACPAGAFGDQRGLSECEPCEAGRYSKEGAFECNGCELGRFSSAPAAELCDPCPAGRFANVTGAESCQACNGQCPSNSSSHAVGAQSSEECCCPVGTFGLMAPGGGTPGQAQSGLAQSGGQCSPYISLGVLMGVITYWNALPTLSAFEQDFQRNLEGRDAIVKIPKLSPLLRLHIQVVNTDEQVPLAQQGLTDLVRGERGYTPVMGVLGAIHSSVSLPTATIGALLETVQISSSSTNAQLSNRQLYPFFLRTVPSDDFQSKAILRCVLHFEVWGITMIYYGDSFGLGIFQKLRELALAQDLVSLVHGEELREMHSGFDEDMAEAVVRSTKAVGTPFVASVMNQAMSAKVLPIMKRGGLWSPTFQLLFAERSPEQPAGSLVFFMGGQSEREALFWDLMSRQLPADFIGPSAVEKWKMDRWDPKGGELKDAKVNVSALNAVDGDVFMPFFFDAIYVFAHAFNSLLLQGMDPGDLRGKLLLEAASRVNFSGASGQVYFNEDGDRLMDYALLNIQLGDGEKHDTVQVGTYSAAKDELRIFGATQVYWMDDSWSATPPQASIGCLSGFFEGDERGQCVKGSRGGFPQQVDDDGIVTWLLPLILSVVVVLMGCCLATLALWHVRERRRCLGSMYNNPTDISSPSGNWTARWVGQHVFSKITMRGSSRAITSSLSVSRTAPVRTWVVNATPFAAMLQSSRRTSNASGNVMLQPFSAWRAPCATQELEVEIFQMAGCELETWQTLPAAVSFTMEELSWGLQGYECPVRRVALPEAETGQRAGHLRLVKGPNNLLLISWSPPAEVRGMPLDEFERFLTEVKDSRTDGDSGAGTASNSLEDVDMYGACAHVIKQDVARMDASYAELRTQYGPPDLFISHVWSETAKNTLKAVRNFVKSQMDASHRPTMLGMVPVECRVWFCTACNNQSRVAEELGTDVQLSPFARVIASPQCSKVALISPFLALTRKWCTFEFSLARHAQKTTILVTTSGVVEAGQVAPRTLEDLAKQVSHFSSASAGCSSLEDSHMIDAAVSQMGGYEEIDMQVRGACRSAIEEAHRWTSNALDSLKTESPFPGKVAAKI